MELSLLFFTPFSCHDDNCNIFFLWQVYGMFQMGAGLHGISECHGPPVLPSQPAFSALFWSHCFLDSFPTLKPATPAGNHTHLLTMILITGTLFHIMAGLQPTLDHWMTQCLNSQSVLWWKIPCPSSWLVTQLSCLVQPGQQSGECRESRAPLANISEWIFERHRSREGFTAWELGNHHGGNHVFWYCFARRCLFLHCK